MPGDLGAHASVVGAHLVHKGLTACQEQRGEEALTRPVVGRVFPRQLVVLKVRHEHVGRLGFLGTAQL